MLKWMYNKVCLLRLWEEGERGVGEDESEEDKRLVKINFLRSVSCLHLHRLCNNALRIILADYQKCEDKCTLWNRRDINGTVALSRAVKQSYHTLAFILDWKVQGGETVYPLTAIR